MEQAAIQRILSHLLSSSSAAAPRRYLTAPSPATVISAEIPAPMASMNATAPAKIYQNVIVMRHGDRLDNFVPDVDAWVRETARPWDPPLNEKGCHRSHATGVELRTQLGFTIDRVVVSPFMRCVETASEVVSALLSSEERVSSARRVVAPIGPPAIKVCVDYGLCEMFNGVAIRHPPKDPTKEGEWGFELSQIKLKFPEGTVDPQYEPVADKLPKWGETRGDARARYERVLGAIADKYPCENLLLITHGEGLKATVSTILNGTRIHDVKYCAFVKLGREIITLNGDSSLSAKEFGDVSHHGYLLEADDA
ncbi:hypothetical protein SAY87_021116 [Trapa incisa]|uniref:Phosphoglycerate mutase family protein n=1 Tax=Trapa incisa TaxID=236973 RepID=A0AAN7JWP2_9MYRT|nr:hypothetical protein SAY87_021116 [Trapa incisa]